MACVVSQIKGLGLRVAANETKALLFCKRGAASPPGTHILIDGVRISPGK